MAESKCSQCSMRGVCRESRVSWVFFLVGLVATVAMRVIEPLRSVNPLYGKASWYVGVAGFFLFFVYKYKVLVERSRLMEDAGLAGRIASSSRLSRGDYVLLNELLCSHDNWKERVNFFVIFALSAVALLFAFWFDFFV